MKYVSPRFSFKTMENRGERRTVFLEVIVALEAAAQTIKGLAGLTDPESDRVECFTHRTHPLLLLSDSRSGFLLNNWWLIDYVFV